MKRQYLIALILLGSLVAFAQTSDIRGTKDQLSLIPASGNEFLRVCGNESMTDIAFGYCHGYLYGVWEMFELNQVSKTHVCIPVGVTHGQEYSIVVKFIRDNPKLAQAATANLIPMAIMDAFPCPKK
jgi:hypothetical protein